jgi:hypothetical protein
MKKENNLYNLMTQFTQESKSLWRMKQEYIKDAGKDAELKKFWTYYSKEKEQHLKDLKSLIIKYMK